MAKRDARTIFDLPEKEEQEELTPLRIQELALSEELKKKVKLPVERKLEKVEKPVLAAIVDKLLKDLA